MSKTENHMMDTERKANAENGRSSNASRSRKNGKRSWMGFYTHVALPMLSLQGEMRQEQC